MNETITTPSGILIIPSHGGYVPANRSGRAGRQATFDPAAEGVLAERQTVFPRRRRMVDGVSSDYTCGLRVRQSVQAIGRRCVPRQVWGSSCVSGSRDTTSDDSSARGLGKAARVQLGRIGHDGQHPKRQQSNLVWLQALCSRGAVLVCPSIVLEEETLVALQGSCSTQGKAQALLEAVVPAQSQRADRQKYETQGSRSSTLDRVQSQTEMFTLRGAAPCGDRLPSRHQGRQEVGQQIDRRTQQFEGCDTRSRREMYSVVR